MSSNLNPNPNRNPNPNPKNMKTQHHLVAMPYPGRGHINPMHNLCTLLLSSHPNLLISFILTQEWLTFLTSQPHPQNLNLVSIPQVIPSEIGRAKDFPGFYEATCTKLQQPFESILDNLEPPVTAIVYDTFLTWVVDVGMRRGIPVASLFTQSASMFSVISHFDLLVQNGHFPLPLDTSVYILEGTRTEKVDYIPGLPSTTIAELPTFFHGAGKEVLPRVIEAISNVNKSQCLLFTSVYELEEEVINALKAKLPIPIYPIGPMIPYFKLQTNDVYGGSSHSSNDKSYLHWLDSQPPESVLYISQGSFLSVSSEQMDEIVAGIKQSGVKFLWVTRGDCSQFEHGITENGCLVPWCDQLRVLCHPSVGGFWTHCGWNSTLEGVFAGVPMLTCPIFWDQVPNSKLIVSDWNIGLKVMSNDIRGTLITRHEISQLVTKFMDVKDEERRKLVKKAKSVQEICRKAIANGGSSASNFADFMRKIL